MNNIVCTAFHNKLKDNRTQLYTYQKTISAAVMYLPHIYVWCVLELEASYFKKPC